MKRPILGVYFDNLNELSCNGFCVFEAIPLSFYFVNGPLSAVTKFVAGTLGVPQLATNGKMTLAILTLSTKTK